MNSIKKYLGLFLIIVLTFSLTACGSENKKAENNTGNSNVKKVTIGIRQDLVPTSYIDEKGAPAGYDVEVAKLIDELLPQYEFQYEGVSQEALLLGLESGKYAAAAAGFYTSKEREEKYLFPKENIGANVIGVVVRPENADVKNLSDFSDKKLKLEPLAGASGIYPIVRDYNKEHPDKPVNLDTVDWVAPADTLLWIKDKRYDGTVANRNQFDGVVKNDPSLKQALVFNPFYAIKTWTLFNKQQAEFAAAYDGALKQLKDQGKLQELSEKYFGENVFQYVK